MPADTPAPVATDDLVAEDRRWLVAHLRKAMFDADTKQRGPFFDYDAAAEVVVAALDEIRPVAEAIARGVGQSALTAMTAERDALLTRAKAAELAHWVVAAERDALAARVKQLEKEIAFLAAPCQIGGCHYARVEAAEKALDAIHAGWCLDSRTGGLRSGPLANAMRDADPLIVEILKRKLFSKEVSDAG